MSPVSAAPSDTRRTPSPGQRSVLIVDDDPAIREVLDGVFREEGFVVTTASNGEVAIQALTSFQPDVIVLDIHMPVMNGIAFARAYTSPDRDRTRRSSSSPRPPSRTGFGPSRRPPW